MAALGVDEAVDALDRALLESPSLVGSPDTPVQRTLLERWRPGPKGFEGAGQAETERRIVIGAAQREFLAAGEMPPLLTISPDTGAQTYAAPARSRIGLLVGLGRILAYGVYLPLDGIRSTLMVAIAALLAVGLNPSLGGSCASNCAAAGRLR